MLNVSNNIVVAYDPTTKKYELPEANICPEGKTAGERRKIDNLKNKFSSCLVYENRPLPGFTLYKCDRQRYGSSDSSWLVIDPRGFLVRISHENLTEILNTTGITEGLIQEKCLWARDDFKTAMKLIPQTSPLYKKAEENTAILESKVKLKEVSIGDTVLMQSGKQGTYLGIHNVYTDIDNYNDCRTGKIFKKRQLVEIEPGKVMYQTNLKILKVIKAADQPKTKTEAAEYINSGIESSSIKLSNSTYFGYTAESVFGVGDGEEMRISRRQIEKIDFLNLYQQKFERIFLAYTTTDGKFYILKRHYRKPSLPITSIDGYRMYPPKEELFNSFEPFMTENKNYYGGRGTQYHETRDTSLDEIEKYYVIEKHINGKIFI